MQCNAAPPGYKSLLERLYSHCKPEAAHYEKSLFPERWHHGQVRHKVAGMDASLTFVLYLMLNSFSALYLHLLHLRLVKNEGNNTDTSLVTQVQNSFYYKFQYGNTSANTKLSDDCLVYDAYV